MKRLLCGVALAASLNSGCARPPAIMPQAPMVRVEPVVDRAPARDLLRRHCFVSGTFTEIFEPAGRSDMTPADNRETALRELDPKLVDDRETALRKLDMAEETKEFVDSLRFMQKLGLMSKEAKARFRGLRSITLVDRETLAYTCGSYRNACIFDGKHVFIDRDLRDKASLFFHEIGHLGPRKSWVGFEELKAILFSLKELGRIAQEQKVDMPEDDFCNETNRVASSAIDTATRVGNARTYREILQKYSKDPEWYKEMCGWGMRIAELLIGILIPKFRYDAGKLHKFIESSGDKAIERAVDAAIRESPGLPGLVDANVERMLKVAGCGDWRANDDWRVREKRRGQMLDKACGNHSFKEMDALIGASEWVFQRYESRNIIYGRNKDLFAFIIYDKAWKTPIAGSIKHRIRQSQTSRRDLFFTGSFGGQAYLTPADDAPELYLDAQFFPHEKKDVDVYFWGVNGCSYLQVSNSGSEGHAAMMLLVGKINAIVQGRLGKVGYGTTECPGKGR